MDGRGTTSLRPIQPTCGSVILVVPLEIKRTIWMHPETRARRIASEIICVAFHLHTNSRKRLIQSFGILELCM